MKAYSFEILDKNTAAYANIFKERAEGDYKDELFSEDKTNGYKEIATGWKWLTFVLIGLGLLFVITIDIILYRYLYPLLPNEIKNSPDFIKNLPLYFGSIKFTFFTILGYAIFISNKNFSNNRHLYNIYRQKADNLKVYKVLNDIFKRTVDDPKVQNEISSYIAKTIFETVDTGFIRQVPENNSVIENIFTKSNTQ